MYKAFKYELRPTESQKITLNEWFGQSRYVWNHFLTKQKEKYQEEKKFIFGHEMITSLPKLKKENEWLKEIPSQALQQKCFDLETAIKRMYKQGNGFPKYKSRHIEHHNTFRINQTTGHIKPTKTQIKIPKIGWIKWKKYRLLGGELKNITIKQENNKWWCVCLCEIPDVEPITKLHESDMVGIDLGLKDLAITSDSEVFKTPKFYRKKQKKLKKEQQILARRIKGSANRQKAKKSLNKIHYKIKCQRHDYTNKVSSAIAKQYLFIGVEDLNIKGMVKNRRLAKSIYDQGWGIFLSQLEYKAKWNGGQMIKIDRWAPSTKTCSCCGKKKNLTLDERTYICAHCGMEMDRDINASINIKRWALDKLNRCGTHRIYACEDSSDGGVAYDTSSYGSLKQEKLSSLEEKPSNL